MSLKYTTQEYAGRRYNHLTVIEVVPFPDHAKFRSVCDCGKESLQQAWQVVSGHVKSCGGCKGRRHGMSNTKVNRAYRGMFERVDAKPGTIWWNNYPARGITVCARWRESFQNFYEDMGDPPGVNHSLDRIDNDGNYEPTNCRWATAEEQSNNTRRNYALNYQGQTFTIAQLAKRVGMEYSLLYNRIYKYKWPVEKAVTHPKKHSR